MSEQSSPRKGKLVVISGPSGTGKTTVCKRLVKLDSRFQFSVSATTRQPRKREIHGRDYFFLSREEFEKKIRQGEMAEYAEYAGNLYGTPKAPLDQAIQQGRVMLMDIDTQGARQVVQAYPEAITIFLEPPDFQELLRRLCSRGTDSEDERDRRLAIARREMSQRDHYDHIVVNDDLTTTVNEIYSIIEKAQNN